MSNSKKYGSRILTLSFIVLITLPLTFSFIGLKSGVTLSENRRIQQMPSLEINDLKHTYGLRQKAKEVYLGITRFIRRFDNYFSTTFSFRSDLLKLYNATKLDILATEPLPQKVVRGKNGWYFLGDSFSNVIKESKGIENFSTEKLTSIVQKINENKDWLKERGIAFYFAVAPNKASVYGAYLPIRQSENKTTTAQLDSASIDRFNFIDLKQDFPTAKDARLYNKTDSHWNDYGAYLAYVTLMQKIKTKFPQAKALAQSDFSIDTVISYQQDLTRMLALKVKEEVIVFKPRKAENAVQQENELVAPKNYTRPPSDYEMRFKSDVNNLKVLVLHDSFTTHLKQFIKESFGEVVFIWDTKFNKALIEKERPDIVIQIIVERHLDLAAQ